MFKIIKKNEWKTSKWSGGITNEIFIYPSQSDYATRNFKARISVATTNNPEKSKFTSLPGVDRFISKLNGDMLLEHENHYRVDMKKFQIDKFKGDWDTYSTGKFQDFNLMLKNVSGNLYFSELSNSTKLLLKDNSNINFLFVIEGKLSIDGINIEENDFFYTDTNTLNINTVNAKIFYGFIKECD